MGLFTGGSTSYAPVNKVAPVKAPPAGTTPFAGKVKTPPAVNYGDLSPAQQAALMTMSPEQIQADAAKTANQQIAGQVAPIAAQGAAQDATALAQQNSTAAFNAAASKLLGSLGPEAQQGYGQAATEIGQLARGFTGGVQQTLTNEEAAAHATANQINPNLGGPKDMVDPSAFGNALYASNGFIPASTMVGRGAAARQWGAGLEAVNTDVGRTQEQALQVQQQAQDAAVATKIAEVAAKYPQLFTAQEHADIQQNLSAIKAAGTLTHEANQDANAQGALNIKTFDANTRRLVVHNQKAAQSWKQWYQQASLDEKTAYNNASLKIRGTEAATAFNKVQQAGGQVDKTSSMAFGYVVLKDGSVPVVVKGKAQIIAPGAKVPKGAKPLPLDPRVYSTTAPTALTSTPVAMSKAIGTVKQLIGQPVAAPQRVQDTTGGKYLLDPALNPTGASDHAGHRIGSFMPPNTTDDPQRAVKDTTVTFSQAVAQIREQYPKLTAKQARHAVIVGGIKPDGKKS